MLITNARLRHREGLHALHLENGRIARITPKPKPRASRPGRMTWTPAAIWWCRPLSNRTFTWTPP